MAKNKITKASDSKLEDKVSALYEKLEKFQANLDTEEKALFAAALSNGKKIDIDSNLVSANGAMIAELRRLLGGTLTAGPNLADQTSDFWAQWAQRQY